MKNTALFASLLIITTSCAPTINLSDPGGTYVSTYDFREYTERGFLFLTDSYWGPYESLGLFTMVIYPEVVKFGTAPSDPDKQYRAFRLFDTQYLAEIIDLQDGIDQSYEFARNMGADAIMNLRITTDAHPGADGVQDVTITGFAIKRLE